MTWELAITIIRDIAIAIISGGLAVQVQKSRSDKKAVDSASDQSIRSELWNEVKEIRKAEADWTKERIAYERRIMELERDNRDLSRLSNEQNEEIMDLNAQIKQEQEKTKDCEGRWANFLNVTDKG